MSENIKPSIGKYGSLIQKAREPKEPENQKTGKLVNQHSTELQENTASDQEDEPEYQNAGKPANQLELESEAGENKRQVNQQTSKPANQPDEEMVNLSIKVSKRRRRHWSAEAKRRDTTLVAAISQALSEKFGEPQD